MTAIIDMSFIGAGGLSIRPDRSLLEQSHQALARIESELYQKLEDITALKCPLGMPEVHWESARVSPANCMNILVCTIFQMFVFTSLDVSAGRYGISGQERRGKGNFPTKPSYSLGSSTKYVRMGKPQP